MASPSQTPQPYIPWFAYNPGIRRCEHILKQLREFQSLIRHYDRIATDIGKAQPLNTLLPNTPANVNPSDVRDEIEAEVHRRALPVRQYLSLAGALTEWTYIDEDGNKVGRDIIADYFRIDLPTTRKHSALMETLEKGIGVYEQRLEGTKGARRRPFYWVSRCMHLPIAAAEEAGWIRTNEQHSKFIEVCLKIIFVLVIVLLALLCAKLGISIPWGKLL